MTETEKHMLTQNPYNLIWNSINSEEKVPYGMMNDYMFRSVLQKSPVALREQVSSIENWPDRSLLPLYYEFTGKFSLHVLDLSYINKVTDDIKNTSLYHWECLFKATTWKEMLAMAEQSESIRKAVVTLRQLTNDEKIKLQCEARERYRTDWQSSMRTSFEKGKKEGPEEAAADTQKLILMTQTLISANRMDDLDRALKDVSYRELLINELHITPENSIFQ